MEKYKDIAGQKFGRWTAIEPVRKETSRGIFWNCICECGTVRCVSGESLRRGKSRSCGCLKVPAKEGDRFGRLVAIRRYKVNSIARWECICDCGNIVDVAERDIITGKTQSCGCLNRENLIRRNTTHGKSGERIYIIWVGMRNRCYKEREEGYKWYGARGISVCDEWLGEDGFQNFYNWSMSHGYRDDLSIDRIDVNGNYEPSNCRWATRKEQGNNTRKNKYITYNGETHTMSEWSDILGINYSVIRTRLRIGWSVEDALSKEIAKRPPEILITHEGETHNLYTWSKIMGVNYQWFWKKYRKGMDISKMIAEFRENTNMSNNNI